LENEAINYLLELYVKITEETEKDESLEQKTRDEFKLLSEGNSESVDLWKKFTSYSIEAMQVQLNRLHIKPDYNI
jgi:arginyl-tRNA synthetase